MDKTQIDLALYRLESAEERLKAAKVMISVGSYKDAVNRTYYAIFNAMRSILALDGVGFKRYSGVISYFRREYIKTGLFPANCSRIIKDSFEIRGQSDYDDFFLVSNEDAEIQYENAADFYQLVKVYVIERTQGEES